MFDFDETLKTKEQSVASFFGLKNYTEVPVDSIGVIEAGGDTKVVVRLDGSSGYYSVNLISMDLKGWKLNPAAVEQMTEGEQRQLAEEILRKFNEYYQ
jgi:hypothetical protein